MPAFTRDDVQAIIDAEGVESLTAKTVRVKLEERLGLESGALKAQKNEISDLIDAILNEGDDNDDAQDDQEEEEEEAPKAKKAKTASKAAKADDGAEHSNKGKMTCTTRSGNDAPKNIKKMQVCTRDAPHAPRSGQHCAGCARAALFLCVHCVVGSCAPAARTRLCATRRRRL